MDTAERDYEIYLRRAAEVDAIAEKYSHPSDKEPLLRVAAEWRRLAAVAAARAGVKLETTRDA